MNMKVTIDIPKSVLLKVVALKDAYDEIGEEKVNEFLASENVDVVVDNDKDCKNFMLAVGMFAFAKWMKDKGL